MTKPNSLDLIQVASPCHVSWDEMSGDERRRFCRHCNLHVYNLSDMPRAEAEEFVNKAEGRTCIRMYRRADGTMLTRDCPVGLRAVRQRLVRSVAALAGMIVALLSGTLFAGRLKIAALEGLKRPSAAFAGWIEPRSTIPVVMGVMACPTPPPVPVPVSVLGAGDPTFEAPESPLPEPTPEQLEAIAERLK